MRCDGKKASDRIPNHEDAGCGQPSKETVQKSVYRVRNWMENYKNLYTQNFSYFYHNPFEATLLLIQSQKRERNFVGHQEKIPGGASLERGMGREPWETSNQAMWVSESSPGAHALTPGRDEHKQKGRRAYKNAVVQEGGSEYKGSNKSPGLTGFQTCLAVHGAPSTNLRRKPNAPTLLRHG